MGHIYDIVKAGNYYFSLCSGEVINPVIINEHLRHGLSILDVSQVVYVQVLSIDVPSNFFSRLDPYVQIHGIYYGQKVWIDVHLGPFNIWDLDIRIHPRIIKYFPVPI